MGSGGFPATHGLLDTLLRRGCFFTGLRLTGYDIFLFHLSKQRLYPCERVAKDNGGGFEDVAGNIPWTKPR